MKMFLVMVFQLDSAVLVAFQSSNERASSKKQPSPLAEADIFLDLLCTMSECSIFQTYHRKNLIQTYHRKNF